MSTVDEKAEGLAENVWLKLVSRIAMILASGFGVPFAIWVVTATYGSIDGMQRNLAAAQTKIELLQQTVQFNAKEAQGTAQTQALNLAAVREIIQQQTTNQYGTRDAERDAKLFDERFRRLEQRLESIERPVGRR